MENFPLFSFIANLEITVNTQAVLLIWLDIGLKRRFLKELSFLTVEPSKHDHLPDVHLFTPGLCNLPLDACNVLTQLLKSDAIVFHSNCKDVIYRIWKHLNMQREDLARFLLLDSDDIETVLSPFPIHAGSRNVTHIDLEEPIHKLGMYRDL